MYFKTIPFPPGTEKIFYGLEGKKDLKFARLKTSFEFFLPKLIVSLSKDPLVDNYRIRPGAVSIAVIGLFGFALFTGFIGILRGTTDLASYSPFLIITAIYAMLFIIELRLTTSRVRKAFEVSNY